MFLAKRILWACDTSGPPHGGSENKRKTNAVGEVLRRAGKLLLHRATEIEIRFTLFPIALLKDASRDCCRRVGSGGRSFC